MKKILFACLSVGCLLQINQSFAATGVYIEGNFGQSIAKEENITGSTDTDSGFAYNATAGYLLNQYFGMEAGYTQYADVSIDQGSATGNDKRTAYDLAAKVIWPTNDKVSVFAKLGLGSVTSSLDSNLTRKDDKDNDLTNNNVYYGLGAAYQINDNFWLNVQYAEIAGSSDVGDSSMASFGITWLVKNTCNCD